MSFWKLTHKAILKYNRLEYTLYYEGGYWLWIMDIYFMVGSVICLKWQKVERDTSMITIEKVFARLWFFEIQIL